MHHHINHSHHCGNHNSTDCGCRRHRCNCTLRRKILCRNSKVNSVKAALFFIYLYAPIVHKQRNRKPDAHFYKRLYNLRYCRRVHITKALIIPAVRTGHTKEKHCRRKHNYRKERTRIVAHRSGKKLASEKHNNASHRAGYNKTGH